MDVSGKGQGKRISHKGTVVGLEDGTARVEIVSESACASCHAAGLCGASESAGKVIMVRIRPWESFKVGDRVEVSLSRTLGLKAVLLSYVVPVFILMIFVVFLSKAVKSELLVGLASLSGIILYYCVLYLFRDSLRGEYEFSITKTL